MCVCGVCPLKTQPTPSARGRVFDISSSPDVGNEPHKLLIIFLINIYVFVCVFFLLYNSVFFLFKWEKNEIFFVMCFFFGRSQTTSSNGRVFLFECIKLISRGKIEVRMSRPRSERWREGHCYMFFLFQMCVFVYLVHFFALCIENFFCFVLNSC